MDKTQRFLNKTETFSIKDDIFLLNKMVKKDIKRHFERTLKKILFSS
jgi:hypothetical protein